jgi:hypothetical protein
MRRRRRSKKTLKSEVNAPWRNLKQEEAREN